MRDHNQRSPDGHWELETRDGLDAHLHLPGIACTVLAEVCERTVPDCAPHPHLCLLEREGQGGSGVPCTNWTSPG